MPYLDFGPQSRLFYYDLNRQSKNAVVLLHGLGATVDSWTLQFDPLTKAGYRVLVFDIPGFGKSTPASGSFPAIERIITNAISQIHPGSVALVGISMGGVIALQIALDFPDIVSKLVLVNTFARLELINFRTWPYYLSRFFLLHVVGLPAQANIVAKRIFPRPEQDIYRKALIAQVVQANPVAYRSMMRSLARFNVRSRLPEISKPTLIITGEQDTTVLPRIQSELVRGIPHARQIIIPEAGHAVSIDHFDCFNELLVNFLSN